MRKVDPLQSNVPIVNSDGTPTPDFMRRLQDIAANAEGLNRSVEDLSNVEPTESTSAGAVVPLTDGAEPPALISDGAGQLIFVPWGP